MTFITVLLLAFLDPFPAQVVSVHDGDTITVRSSETYKIRLYGIDAPELKQPHGQASKHALSKMTFGKSINVIPTGKDRYGRVVAKVESDGVNVNRAMVEQGAAWWYTAYAKGSFDLQNAQSKAQAERIGLWAEMQPIAPWDYRKKGK